MTLTSTKGGKMIGVNLTHRKAKKGDLKDILEMIFDDDLGKEGEDMDRLKNPRYLEAFEQINKDPNQYFMVVERDDEIVGISHLTFIPTLTFTGSLRMQIETVRVRKNDRSHGIGHWLVREAIEYGKDRGAKIIQLTSNSSRKRAIEFYEDIGFVASHTEMKLSLG
jgi:ribosomal protein S18 acetylase RimI-like enzyme